MSKELFDAVSLSVEKLCSAHEAIMQAVADCGEASAAFAQATTGSSQPEVNSARQNYIATDVQLRRCGSIIVGMAQMFANYAASIDGGSGLPLNLAESTQTLIDQGSPYAQTSEPDLDELLPGKLLSSAEYQQFPTTLTTNSAQDTIRVEVPGGYIEVTVHQHTLHGSQANLDYAQVTEGRQQGKGGYLIATAVREASLRGIQNVSGYFTSPYSLQSLGKLLGKENLIIKSPSDSSTYFQTDNYDEAIAALRNQEVDTPEGRYKGVRVRVDLRKSAVQSRLFRRTK